MIDYTLYLVTDRGLAGQKSLTEIVSEAIAGGVSCVQLREKHCSTREFVNEATKLVEILRPREIPLIINDRIDVALAVGADGVHLGQSDMPLSIARKVVGRDMIIGLSAESVEDAVEAEKGGADYIGISPVFHTVTKDDIAEPLGLVGVQQIRKAVQIPLVGIGGISTENCVDVLEAGADGVAVVSAIIASENPRLAAEKLLTRLHSV